MRTASLYVQGGTTFLFFYIDYLRGSSEDIGSISFILMIATALDFGVYNKLIEDQRAPVARTYLQATCFNLVLSVIIYMWLGWKISLLFLTSALYPFWFLRFMASKGIILLYILAHGFVLLLSLIFAIPTLDYFTFRSATVLALIAVPLVNYLQLNIDHTGFSLKEIALPLLLALIANFGLLLSQMGIFSYHNDDFFFDKLGLLIFIVFQFVIKLKESSKIVIGRLRWVLILLSLSIVLLDYWIAARYILDIYGAMLVIESLQEHRNTQVLNASLYCLLISLIVSMLMPGWSVWIIQYIVTLIFVLILEFRRGDFFYIFRKNRR